jgi:endonuclease/exonuclease/phosphatase family metal-dependent hydrolase
VLVLTWNLFHGRAVPEERRSLLAEFASRLASWEWDVALLQEVRLGGRRSWPPRAGRKGGPR